MKYSTSCGDNSIPSDTGGTYTMSVLVAAGWYREDFYMSSDHLINSNMCVACDMNYVVPEENVRCSGQPFQTS